MVFPTDELSVTTTTLAVVLLPQPLRDARQMAARQRPRKLDFLPTFVRTISPTKSRGADLALTLALPSLAVVLVHLPQKLCIAAALKTSG